MRFDVTWFGHVLQYVLIVLIHAMHTQTTIFFNYLLSFFLLSCVCFCIFVECVGAVNKKSDNICNSIIIKSRNRKGTMKVELRLLLTNNYKHLLITFLRKWKITAIRFRGKRFRTRQVCLRSVDDIWGTADAKDAHESPQHH